MGKKNKKHTKINQRIRFFFDDDAFDIGIQRVSSETLSELFHALGILDIEFTQTTLVKEIRKRWSQEGGEFRAHVLEFFEADGQKYASDKLKVVSSERIDKLYELLGELQMTQEEEVLLIAAFKDVRSKKINIDKMESKLKHIRFDMKKEKLERLLDGFFDIDDSLEFNASIRYGIYQQHFHKIVTLNTKPYSFEYLESESIDDIVEKIQSDKELTIQKKQNSVETFLKSIQQPHTYLTDKEIETALRCALSTFKSFSFKESYWGSFRRTRACYERCRSASENKRKGSTTIFQSISYIYFGIAYRTRWTFIIYLDVRRLRFFFTC